MKRLNSKQIDYSNFKAASYAVGKFKSVFSLLTIALLFVAVFAFSVDASVANFYQLLGYGTGAGLTYGLIGIVSVPRADRVEKTGLQTTNRVYLLDVRQADYDNIPIANASLQTLADIPRASGEYWHYLDCQKASVLPSFKSNGDMGLLFDNEVKVTLEGLTETSRKFINSSTGEDFFIVWEICATGKLFIGGSKCSGMKLTIEEGGWLADSTHAKLSFKNQCPDAPYEYVGNITQSAPTAIAADATTKALVTGVNEYQFSANTGATNFTAFTGMVAGDHGRILTLFGASTNADASTIDSGDSFDLLDGTTWTANPGSKISFKIFKTGASTYRFIEVEGTRLQG